MAYEGYECLKIRFDRGVAFVTIDHPPINLLDAALGAELTRVITEIEADDSVRVVVFDSADPEFFIAHYDVDLILQLPTEIPPKEQVLAQVPEPVKDRLATMPKVSIAKIEGRVRGGGSELVLAMDMRFGALGRAILAQPEVGIGIIPGGGGTQRLPRLVGRSRALEVILGCDDVAADVAERYGYINRALPPEELEPFVARLAYNIASFSPEAIAMAKACVNKAMEMPLREGLKDETYTFLQSVALPATQRRMKRFLEAGGQTRQGELDLSYLFAELAAAD